jgi:hypothetical protein
VSFGFTNDESQWNAANAYREAAIKDGWDVSQLSSEPIESWCKLERLGFVTHVLARVLIGCKWKYQAMVSIWGPDGLAIPAPKTYDWSAISSGTTQCMSCGKAGVEIHRFSFAGRCCADCLPAMREQYEYPGWCD